MVSLEKIILLIPLQKLPKNVEDWGKLIIAKGFKKLPKVQNIAQSGHTEANPFQKIIFAKTIYLFPWLITFLKNR